MATYQVPNPTPMRLKGDLKNNWKIFKEEWDDYIIATKLDEEDKKVQAATLKRVMGSECKERLKALELTAAQQQDPAVILEKLTAHFTPVKNKLYDRCVFSEAHQLPNETIDQYVLRLRHLASSCDWGEELDNMLRDRLILGCRDAQARARAFRKKDCTLADALDILRVAEATSQQLKKLYHEEEHVNYTQRSNRRRRNYQPPSQTSYRPSRQESQQKTNNRAYKPKSDANKTEAMKQRRSSEESCTRCGRQHERNCCPARGKACNKCNRLGHFAVMCYTSRPNRPHQMKKMEEETKEQEESEDSSDESAFQMQEETISSIQSPDQGKLIIPLKLKTTSGTQRLMNCEIDTGTSCEVMSHRTWSKMEQSKKTKLRKTKTKLRTYNGEYIPVLGETTMTCNHHDQKFELIFKIVTTDKAPTQAPLISRGTAIAMGLIEVSPEVLRINHLRQNQQAEDLVNKYSAVFEGLGCLPGAYDIDIDNTVKPVQHTPRRVPVPLKNKLKDKIDELEKTGIIAQVTEPTPWISSIVTVMKPGKLRVCLDPRDLNTAIRRSNYQTPTIDEILPDLANAKVFSVLDAKDGFHQVKLTEESSKLTCFWTPFGRYRYLRMPFGIKSAPEEWQRRIDEIIQGLPGVKAIADDILVYGCGETEEEYMQDHNANLERLLKKAQEVNLKINKHKLKLCLSEVSYMGHRLTSDGIKSDPAKVQAIIDMPAPETKQQVQTLIGCVNYLSRYMPRLATVCEPIRQLTEKEAVFVWQSSQQEAFQQMKELLAAAPVLKYYDVNQEVTIQADASEKGLGGTLLQNGQPIAFASRALNKTEQNYAQIEKEALAIVFSCERFNQYIHGREMVTVHTDHKPLVPIFKKSIQQAPKRLQRMRLRLQKYNLDIQYLPGPQMYIADCLSRNFVKTSTTSKTPTYQIFKIERETKLYEEIEQIRQVDHINCKAETIDELKKETAADNTLQTLKTVVLQGWPEERSKVPVNIREYFNCREEITVQNGILYRGMQVIVPKTLQSSMLKKLHYSHLGIEATLRRARDVLFWPGMTGQIKDLIQNCSACNTYQDKQQAEPMMSYPIPTRPWTLVSQDLFSYNGDEFLITVDHYSDYWEMDKITGDTRAEVIVEKTKKHFATHGIPEEIITDNGPQFIAQEYANFAEQWNFKHITTSPYHSQSNGKAESAVKIAKKLLKKTSKSNQDFTLALLDWRNTPKADGSSPVQKLMSRRTNTMLPTSEQLLKPEVVEGVQDTIKLRKQKAKKQYDKSARSLPELKIGQQVRVQPTRHTTEWKLGVCEAKVGPRSYLVKTVDGQTYRRNRKFLRPSSETEIPTEPVEDYSDDDYDDYRAPPQDNQPARSPRRPSQRSAGSARGTSQRSAGSARGTSQQAAVSSPPPPRSTRSRSNIKQPARFQDYIMD